jgi:hypothetical protein
VIALIVAAALTPQMAQEIRETLPPGSPPRIEELATSGELVLYCLVTKNRAQVGVARFVGGKLQGDPDDVSGPLPRESCGAVELGTPFEVKRGRKRSKAIVVHLKDAGVTAVVSLAGKTIAWTDAPAPDGAPAIFPESRKGDTSFCAFLTSTKAWTRVAWVPEAGDYAPVDGRCGR